MKEQLTKSDILYYLEQINIHLRNKSKYGEIIIAGGAALTLVFEARDSTYDIDCIFRPKEDLRDIIVKVAQDNELHPDWLNDGVKGFITDRMNQSLVYKFSNLKVMSLDAESLLAMKLTSARAASKDMEDSVFLMNVLGLKSFDEVIEIITKYTYANQQTIQSKYFAFEAFDRYKNQIIFSKDQEDFELEM